MGAARVAATRKSVSSRFDAPNRARHHLAIVSRHVLYTTGRYSHVLIVDIGGNRCSGIRINGISANVEVPLTVNVHL